MSRPFAAPPELPPTRAKALEMAFLAVQRDPQYLQDAATLKVDVSPVGGEDVLQAIERMSGTSPDLLDGLKKLLAQSH